jgi:hypothetical protein
MALAALWLFVDKSMQDDECMFCGSFSVYFFQRINSLAKHVEAAPRFGSLLQFISRQSIVRGRPPSKRVIGSPAGNLTSHRAGLWTSNEGHESVPISSRGATSLAKIFSDDCLRRLYFSALSV